MNTNRHLITDIAVRAIALVAVQVGYQWVWGLADPESAASGADIGAGLIGLGLVIVVAAVWGFLDGRGRTPGRLALTWLAAGLANGVVLAVSLLVRHDVSLWFTDLVVLPIFYAAVIAAPPTFAGAIGHAVFHRGPAEQPH